MYDELIKRLRELQTITKHCGEQSCDECENRELCDKHDNKTLSGTYQEAADAIEELHDICVGKWIPVTERLPEDGQKVLALQPPYGGSRYYYSIVYFSTNLEKVDMYDFQGKNRSGFYALDSEYGWIEHEVAYWMPLPEPPKEE